MSNVVFLGQRSSEPTTYLENDIKDLYHGIKNLLTPTPIEKQLQGADAKDVKVIFDKQIKELEVLCAAKNTNLTKVNFKLRKLQEYLTNYILHQTNGIDKTIINYVWLIFYPLNRVPLTGRIGAYVESSNCWKNHSIYDPAEVTRLVNLAMLGCEGFTNTSKALTKVADNFKKDPNATNRHVVITVYQKLLSLLPPSGSTHPSGILYGANKYVKARSYRWIEVLLFDEQPKNLYLANPTTANSEADSVLNRETDPLLDQLQQKITSGLENVVAQYKRQDGREAQNRESPPSTCTGTAHGSRPGKVGEKRADQLLADIKHQGRDLFRILNVIHELNKQEKEGGWKRVAKGDSYNSLKSMMAEFLIAITDGIILRDDYQSTRSKYLKTHLTIALEHKSGAEINQVVDELRKYVNRELYDAAFYFYEKGKIGAI